LIKTLEIEPDENGKFPFVLFGNFNNVNYVLQKREYGFIYMGIKNGKIFEAFHIITN